MYELLRLTKTVSLPYFRCNNSIINSFFSKNIRTFIMNNNIFPHSFLLRFHKLIFREWTTPLHDSTTPPPHQSRPSTIVLYHLHNSHVFTPPRPHAHVLMPPLLARHWHHRCVWGEKAVIWRRERVLHLNSSYHTTFLVWWGLYGLLDANTLLRN
mgnify:CR=1 FL=1